jgi:hypothetical protein
MLPQDEGYGVGRVKESPPFRPGEQVILDIPPGRAPRFGWGNVENGDIGVVRECRHDGSHWVVMVDFPTQWEWAAVEDELVSIWDMY